VQGVSGWVGKRFGPVSIAGYCIHCSGVPHRMAACERKFSEEAAEWQARLDASERTWQARTADLEQVWGE
jgi:hypothetical protein